MVRAAYTHHKTMVVVLKAPLIVFTFYTHSGAFFIRNIRARRARKKIGNLGSQKDIPPCILESEKQGGIFILYHLIGRVLKV